MYRHLPAPVMSIIKFSIMSHESTIPYNRLEGEVQCDGVHPLPWNGLHADDYWVGLRLAIAPYRGRSNGSQPTAIVTQSGTTLQTPFRKVVHSGRGPRGMPRQVVGIRPIPNYRFRLTQTSGRTICHKHRLGTRIRCPSAVSYIQHLALPRELAVSEPTRPANRSHGALPFKVPWFVEGFGDFRADGAATENERRSMRPGVWRSTSRGNRPEDMGHQPPPGPCRTSNTERAPLRWVLDCVSWHNEGKQFVLETSDPRFPCRQG